ncbi:prenyltransferase/squalene oxidase repeat-containing protein [Phytohabitans sp. ZYX-F-186]|uniref:Prenyltransferase/squalene oxidase repeat-containing protein n=1 Tax=Phytohabitans maris TaxID=3071409 RepID=A0ABU0ZEU6_9ACTN|nr:prenyltransferase/squalene oxidase repeat-containing protein [Phytohabitans sp. ZYX-F-186]MDQ7905579.1 prenyltransferase/squalene oxidase repeat-containing protein [Phytohabitans sp. ZYX-F-186]
MDAEESLSGGGTGIAAAAHELIGQLTKESWGYLSPSVYETGRLVALAPWLTGHERRMEFLAATQRADGAWGTPEEYALVSTLSATDALLGAGDGRFRDVAAKGLAVLFRRLAGGPRLSMPDTPAIEIIVPALIASINHHLERGDAGYGARLPVPDGTDGPRLAKIRSAVGAGAAVPTKLLHSLEVAGDAARAAATVQPGPRGTVGASPAATAAWLGGPPGDRATGGAVDYLEAIVARHGGPVPSVVPVTQFERAWVLNTLARAGVEVAVPAELLTGMAEHLDERGTPGGAGLPPDADTTSAVLLALARWGDDRGLEALSAYETDTHFVTWHGERTASTSANAHVLDALGEQVIRTPSLKERYARAIEKVTLWLAGQQSTVGAWVDKWHASPYYATACCAVSLHRYGTGPHAAAAVARAREWVVGTQRADGSWGRWEGTPEETAYALQILLLTAGGADSAAPWAAARGYSYLRATFGRQPHPPLWHDKDLYVPVAIIRAEILAALHLASRKPAVWTLVERLESAQQA